MAKVIITDQQVIIESGAMWARTIALGAAVGLIFWILAVLIGRYVVEPIACGATLNAEICLDTKPLSGMIAAVLAAAIGVIAMVRIGAARPIVVAVAAAAILWPLGGWASGLFWLETLGWSVLLYALTYALFAWITRHDRLWLTIVVSLGLVIVVRLIAAL
jgi:hypothetical protein